MSENKRGSFSSGLGFVLAAAGSAVGLGNIWRFPYLAAQYGGGIFLLVYLILVVTFGFTLLMMELAMTKTMKINGMMCGHCEARVKKTLEALEQVTEAVVSHEAGTAVVTLSAEISNEELKKVIEAQDYEVVSVE